MHACPSRFAYRPDQFFTTAVRARGVYERGWRRTVAGQYIHQVLAGPSGGFVLVHGDVTGGEPRAGSAPDASIVIVSYNTREMLAACLRSCRENAGALCLQLIVVDNASGDGSPEMVAREFPEV